MSFIDDSNASIIRANINILIIVITISKKELDIVKLSVIINEKLYIIIIGTI